MRRHAFIVISKRAEAGSVLLGGIGDDVDDVAAVTQPA